jgi:hypothetical protein
LRSLEGGYGAAELPVELDPPLSKGIPEWSHNLKISVFIKSTKKALDGRVLGYLITTTMNQTKYALYSKATITELIEIDRSYKLTCDGGEMKVVDTPGSVLK